MLALVVAALLVAAMSKPGKTLVGGIFQRDRRGRMTIVLTPTPRPKRRKRGRVAVIIAVRENDDKRQPAVIDAEHVQPEPAPARPRRIVDATATVRRRAVNVATHERTRATAKAGGRHAWYIVAGAGVGGHPLARRTRRQPL